MEKKQNKTSRKTVCHKRKGEGEHNRVASSLDGFRKLKEVWYLEKKKTIANELNDYEDTSSLQKRHYFLMTSYMTEIMKSSRTR